MCLAIVVGKKASKAGSIIFAHSEQNYNKHPVIYNYYQGNKYLDIYQLEKPSFNFIHAEVPKLEYSDNCINDNGVVIAGNGCPSIYADGQGIGYAFPQIIAKYAKSAKHALSLVEILMKTYGYQASGRTFTIADREDAYVVALLSGNHWLAYKVPDEAVVVTPNTFVLGSLAREDFEIEFFGSSEIISKVSQGSFSFAKYYAKEEDSLNLRKETGIDSRQHYIQELIIKEEIPLDKPLKFAIKPKEKLDIRSVINLMRSHHFSEDIHQSEEEIEKSYYRSGCNIATQECAVFDLAEDIIVYRALSVPCLSPFVPYYYKDKMPDSLCHDLKDHFKPASEIYDQGVFWDFYQAVYKTNQDKALAEKYKAEIKEFEDSQFSKLESISCTKEFTASQLSKAVELSRKYGS